MHRFFLALLGAFLLVVPVMPALAEEGAAVLDEIGYVKPCLLDEDAAVRRAAVGYLSEAIIFLDDRAPHEVVGLLRALAGSDPALREKALEVVGRVRAD